MKEEFYFDSTAPGERIHAVLYAPEGEVKAVLQITHGMAEFIERYEPFALFLNEKGFAVAGNDHLGHGASAKTKDDFGYFADKDGNAAVLADVHKLTGLVKARYPGVPYFLLGHSMGSFYARQYLFTYGEELDGAVIMGTGCQPKALVRAGKAMTSLVAAFKGWRHRSDFINNMAFGSYNKKFEPARTPVDWLSRNEENVDKYVADERCGFVFTLNGYYNMFTGIERLYDPANLAKMPKALPVLFTSGADDPVGDFGAGVKRAMDMFEAAGMEHVTLKLYPGDRHEILNEVDRDVVWNDLYTWLAAAAEKDPT